MARIYCLACLADIVNTHLIKVTYGQAFKRRRFLGSSAEAATGSVNITNYKCPRGKIYIAKVIFFLTWQAITPTSPRTASFLLCLKELFETWQYIIGTCCSAGLMPCLPDGNSISPESRQITTSQDDVVSLRSSVEVAMVRAELNAMKALHVDKTNKN